MHRREDSVAEIHTYHWIGDEMRFLPAYKAPADGRPVAAKAPVRQADPRPPRLRRGKRARNSDSEQVCRSEDGGEVQPEGRALA